MTKKFLILFFIFYQNINLNAAEAAAAGTAEIPSKNTDAGRQRCHSTGHDPDSNKAALAVAAKGKGRSIIPLPNPLRIKVSPAPDSSGSLQLRPASVPTVRATESPQQTEEHFGFEPDHAESTFRHTTPATAQSPDATPTATQPPVRIFTSPKYKTTFESRTLDFTSQEYTALAREIGEQLTTTQAHLAAQLLEQTRVAEKEATENRITGINLLRKITQHTKATKAKITALTKQVDTVNKALKALQADLEKHK